MPNGRGSVKLRSSMATISDAMACTVAVAVAEGGMACTPCTGGSKRVLVLAGSGWGR